MGDDEATRVVRAGWMKKKGQKGNVWGDRYFKLKGTTLYYYLKETDLEPKGALVLTQACQVSEIRSNATKKQKQFLFRIVFPVEEDEEAKKKGETKSSWFSYVMGTSSNNLNFEGSTNGKEKSVVFACEKYIDAEKWAHALQAQIQGGAQAANPNAGSAIAVSSSAGMNASTPPPEVRLADVEEWVKSAKWKVSNVDQGIRIFQLDDGSSPVHPLTAAFRGLITSERQPLPCLKISVPLNCSATDVFLTIMNYPPGCRSGIIQAVRIIEYIDNCTDVIHIVLDALFLPPSWTAPRDFCLIRYWRQNTDGSHIVCMDSTVHTDCPLVDGHIRGDLHAAYIVSPPKDGGGGEEEPMDCLLTFIGQMDPKGWIPHDFDYPHLMLQSLMLHVLDIRDSVDVERFVQAHFDPTNEERRQASTTQNSSQLKAGDDAVGGAASTSGSIASIPPPTLPSDVWADIDASTFKIRSVSYNLDKVKAVSAPALFKLIAIDLFELPEPRQNICAHPKNRVALAHQRGESAWVFVMNIMVPGPPFLSFVCYLQGDPALIEQNTPFGRVAKKFFHGNDDEFRNNRFKLIPKIIDGNMLIKMAVKDTPALLGNKLKQYYHKGENYFEVDVDVGSSSIARNVVGLAIGYSKAIVVDMALCLQGDEEDELPEVIMGGCTCIHVDCSKAKKL